MLLPLVLTAPISAADELIYIGYSSPAICTDAGKESVNAGSNTA